jgi:riboflavin biosynthesis pyrimidine reductase
VKGPGWKRTLPLPPAVRLVWHASEAHPRDVPLGDLYTRLAFPASPAPLPYLVANMIMTQNGEAAVEGKAATIGTPVDALVLTRLRAAADVLLTGAGTMAAEDVVAALPEAEVARRTAERRPRRLLVAVLASDLAWDETILSRRFFSDSRFEKVILTGDRAAPEDVRHIEARGVEVVRVASGQDGRPDVRAALEALSRRGARLVVSEGGPRVLASLMRAKVLHEYFLTTSPCVTGEAGVPRPIMGAVTSGTRPVLLARVSRYEYAFADPESGAALVEAYDRFRIVYPP